MKLLLCGKGGCGKSTVTALLAQSIAAKGCNVLVMDSNRSSFGLHRQLGLELPEDFLSFLKSLNPFSKKQEHGKEFEAKFKFFEPFWQLSDIPELYITRKGSLGLVSVGKFNVFEKNCALPAPKLFISFLSKLKTGTKDFVLVDTEAIVEPFGGGLEQGCDLILMVLDHSYESIRLSEKVANLCEKAGKKIYYIFNKVDGSNRTAMLGAIGKERVLSVIPPNEKLFQAGLVGREFDVFLPEIEGVASSLISGKFHFSY
ncbi:MAG: P-loop NTPase [Methanosarcinaceae archaeon]|nr:P-loop NTPase [Methanosarcinaceae archaeon]MDD4748910.1 P-loop NTPase [Methanosarcinaceae archaeon]